MFNQEMIQDYKKNNVSLNDYPAVVGLHKWKGIKSIYSEYFCFLHENFGFEQPIRILHGVFFKHTPFLFTPLYKALSARLEIKLLLENENLQQHERMVLESKSTELKLKINACYGYTLCRENNLNSPYVVETIKSNKAFNTQIKRDYQDNFLTSARPFGSDHWIVSNKNINAKEFNSTPLIAVGASILGNSKIILLDNVCFILQYLDPRLGEACYFDTDSVFLALHYPNLEDNVPPPLRKEFLQKKNHYINSNNRISGFLVLEKVNSQAQFYGEKMYLLSNEHKNTLGFKGVPGNVAKQICDKPNILHQQRVTVTYTTLKRKLDFPMVIENQSKQFKKAIIPSKRKFYNCHSVTY